jgi:hypothetical protein
MTCRLTLDRNELATLRVVVMAAIVRHETRMAEMCPTKFPAYTVLQEELTELGALRDKVFDAKPRRRERAA